MPKSVVNTDQVLSAIQSMLGLGQMNRIKVHNPPVASYPREGGRRRKRRGGPGSADKVVKFPPTAGTGNLWCFECG